MLLKQPQPELFVGNLPLTPPLALKLKRYYACGNLQIWIYCVYQKSRIEFNHCAAFTFCLADKKSNQSANGKPFAAIEGTLQNLQQQIDAIETPSGPQGPVGPKGDDGDGFTPGLGDCDDGYPDINPIATDIAGDGIDADCDGADEVTSLSPLAQACDRCPKLGR